VARTQINRIEINNVSVTSIRFLRGARLQLPNIMVDV